MLARLMAPLLAAMLAGSSVAFVALALLVAAGATRALDLASTVTLQSFANDLFDLIANLNTLIGQPTVTTVAALALAAYLWRRERGLAWIAPLLIALTVVVGTGMKFFLEHPGPGPEFVAITFLARIYIGDHWLSDAAGGLALGVGAGSLASAWADRSAGTGQRIDPPPPRPHKARS